MYGSIESDPIDSIFAMARGFDNVTVNCANGSCDVTVSRTDTFGDPEDIGDYKDIGHPKKPEYNKHGTPFDFSIKCSTKKKQCGYK